MGTYIHRNSESWLKEVIVDVDFEEIKPTEYVNEINNDIPLDVLIDTILSYFGIDYKWFILKHPVFCDWMIKIILTILIQSILSWISRRI